MKEGTIFSINISSKKGVKKTAVDSVLVIENKGLEKDAHGGPWHRQISLLSLSSIEKMQKLGLSVGPGDFAENLTVENLDVVNLPIGQKVKVGSHVTLEITQIGKECHSRCEIYEQAGDCVMPKEGVFARVLQGGQLQKGDRITLI